MTKCAISANMIYGEETDLKHIVLSTSSRLHLKCNDISQVVLVTAVQLPRRFTFINRDSQSHEI